MWSMIPENSLTLKHKFPSLCPKSGSGQALACRYLQSENGYTSTLLIPGLEDSLPTVHACRFGTETNVPWSIDWNHQTDITWDFQPNSDLALCRWVAVELTRYGFLLSLVGGLDFFFFFKALFEYCVPHSTSIYQPQNQSLVLPLWAVGSYLALRNRQTTRFLLILEREKGR